MKWVALVALVSVAYAAQDQILLRRELTEGATEVYKVDSVLKQNITTPMGDQDMVVTTSASCSVKVGKVDKDKGLAAIETVTKVDSTKLDGSLAAMMGGGQDPKLPEPKTEKGSLDNRNRLTMDKPVADPKAPKDSGDSSGMMGMLKGLTSPGAATLLGFLELPEKQIKIGDSWDIALPGGAASTNVGVKDVKITVTYTGEKEIDGQKVYVLATKGSFKLDFDSSKMPKKEGEQASPFGDFKMTGTAEVSGEGYVDKATGKTISNTVEVKTKTNFTLVQMAMDLPTVGTVTMTLKLQK